MLAATLRALPAAERALLVPGPGTRDVPFAAVVDAVQVAEAVLAGERRWGTPDTRVLATLWWYSVSTWFQAPAVASLLATGTALSPRLDDVTAHRLPDGRVVAATSARTLPGADPVAALGGALREVLDTVVPRVAAAGGLRHRPLWAIAADSTGNLVLRVGHALGRVERACAVAEALAAAVGAPLPRPRWVDVVPVGASGEDEPQRGTRRFVRRSSCCLLDRAPGQPRCGSCPRRAPADRVLRMGVAAGLGACEA